MKIIIRGIVQGVGFRPTVYRAALSLGIHGRVWNDGPDVVINSDRGDELLNYIVANLPPLARIESIEKEDSLSNYNNFEIITSELGSKGVGIPTDTAICSDCLEDMRAGRRNGYPFTTCTNCGPRFTLLNKLPYDRNSTAMGDFPMCPTCGKEYSNPEDRRFHHQTVCCPDCGPKYYLVDRKGNEVPGDPIPTFAKLLSEGKIGVAKSWGGMHICCLPEFTKELREWYGRKNKPFALMVKNLDTAKKFGKITDSEKIQLESGHRPIVLIEKISSEITELLSPGLDNIGIFLPYTGMQYALFDCLDSDSLIMTSANVPGEPMLLEDKEVFELGADYYLLHNQKIINRADDSVVRSVNNHISFIRKSRGHIPSYIPFKGCDAVGIGAQENLTASVLCGNRIHTTQHIGNGESLGVTEYLEEATRSLISMVGCEPSVIAMDLHPGYSNRRFGKILAEENSAEIMEIQHHWAHCAALFAENNEENGVVLALDGTGHGDDGNAWGGEVLSCDFTSYQRIAHLEYVPLLGSERALYDLRRLKFAVDSINGVENNDFDDRSSAVLEKLMNTSVKTSSMGRLLDTLAYTLDVCKERTYDGEAAMKMEPLLARGKLISGFETNTENGVVKTAHMFENINNQKKEDVAYSIVYNTMSELVESARMEAESKGIKSIGLSGGVSYNNSISQMFQQLSEKTGLKQMFHEKIPNGDGGISVGQTAIASRHLL